MNSISVLLIDTTDAVKWLLEKRFAQTESYTFTLSHINTKIAAKTLKANFDSWDVVLLGERSTSGTVKGLTKILRTSGFRMPIVLLTRLSEASVPRALQKIGVDDILNISEIDSPVFLWTFMSMLRQADIRKKANEFNVIRNRLQQVNESLAFIAHEINNPLSVIRLALYQLEKKELSKTKQELFFKMLVENISRVDEQMKELHAVRRQLGEDTHVLTKIISKKAMIDHLVL